MKPQVLADLKDRTLEQSIEAIRTLDSLGVASRGSRRWLGRQSDSGAAPGRG